MFYTQIERRSFHTAWVKNGSRYAREAHKDVRDHVDESRGGVRCQSGFLFDRDLLRRSGRQVWNLRRVGAAGVAYGAEARLSSCQRLTSNRAAIGDSRFCALLLGKQRCRSSLARSASVPMSSRCLLQDRATPRHRLDNVASPDFRFGTGSAEALLRQSRRLATLRSQESLSNARGKIPRKCRQSWTSKKIERDLFVKTMRDDR